MLEILRKHSNSLVTKIILFFIVMVFVFFFGWNSFRRATPQTTIAAKVDGDTISHQEVQMILDNQMRIYEQLYKGNLPAGLKERLQSQALDGLIEQKILIHSAKKSGLRVSSEELYDIISKDTNLQTDGKFDIKKYKEVFRPWFFNKTGQDYEELLYNEKLAQKMEDSIRSAVVITDDEIKDQFTIENTKIALELVEIKPSSLVADFTPPKADVTKALEARKTDLADEKDRPSDDELKKGVVDELKNNEGIKRAEELAKNLWTPFTTGKLTEKALKEKSLELKKIPLTSVSKPQVFFPNGPDSTEGNNYMKDLLSLSKDKPYPAHPLRIGASTWLIKLVDRAEPNLTELDGKKETIRSQLISERGGDLYQKWYADTLKKAKVKVY